MTRIKLAAILGTVAVLALSDYDWARDFPQIHVLSSPVQARPGHPLTPLSAAGVARRTARRVVRRTSVTYDALPSNCVFGSYFGGMYYNCSGIFFESIAGTYVQVTID